MMISVGCSSCSFFLFWLISYRWDPLHRENDWVGVIFFIFFFLRMFTGTFCFWVTKLQNQKKVLSISHYAFSAIFRSTSVIILQLLYSILHGCRLLELCTEEFTHQMESFNYPSPSWSFMVLLMGFSLRAICLPWQNILWGSASRGWFLALCLCWKCLLTALYCVIDSGVCLYSCSHVCLLYVDIFRVPFLL